MTKRSKMRELYKTGDVVLIQKAADPATLDSDAAQMCFVAHNQYGLILDVAAWNSPGGATLRVATGSIDTLLENFNVESSKELGNVTVMAYFKDKCFYGVGTYK